ncbi:MAG: hypothetical protein J6N49_04015 [Alphaproteobacteria bacterium]|nr:hypothetical protein [Alphaproteobacteria bacterium]
MANDLNHEFCAKFRAEIKDHGLIAVISELLVSTSDKVALKKKYLTRECRKNAFAGKFTEACATIVERNRRLSHSVYSLKQEIIGQP